MNYEVTNRIEFEHPATQARGFNSAHHDGFYIVTAFGFPLFIYIRELDRWFSSSHEMLAKGQLWTLRPDADLTMVTAKVLTDIYRRGFAGLAKHRILGNLT